MANRLIAQPSLSELLRLALVRVLAQHHAGQHVAWRCRGCVELSNGGLIFALDRAVLEADLTVEQVEAASMIPEVAVAVFVGNGHGLVVPDTDTE